MCLVLAALFATAACGDTSSATRSQASTTAASPAPTSTAPPPTTTASSSPTTARPPRTTAPQATTAPPPTGPCAVGSQSPPTGSIPATFATALAFAPDGRLFFAERAGRVRVFQDGAVKAFATVPTVTSGERGLLGLAISPTFATDRFVYAFYSNANGARQDVIRWTDCGGEGRDPEVIVQLPIGGTCCHKGGRLAFGRDGKLYVTLGDQHTPAAAADPSDVRGKILRYNPDGSIPADNPFGGDNPVWATGFRNPFGIAFSPSGRLAVTSNGPSGDAGSPGTGYDIVATDVARGSRYQWPACYGYSHPIRGATCEGNEPEWSSEERAVVPTGATFVNASGPSPYAGKLVFCSLNDGMLVLTEASPHATVTQGESGCLLDVKQGPDNALYFSDTSRIHRAG